MEEKENNPLITIDTESGDLINKISKAKNKDELEYLYQQFNINNTKKNAIRISQLNQLLDKVNNEAAERLTKRPEQISNKEMLDYMNAIGNQIERSQKLVDGIKDITAVQVNNNTQNTVNINLSQSGDLKLNKESRNKITDIISMILQENNNQQEVIDVSNEKEDNISNQDKTISDDEFEGDN